VVGIVWELDLQLSLQSVHITTKVASSNSAHDEVYSIRYYMIKFVSDLRQVDGILQNPNVTLFTMPAHDNPILKYSVRLSG
jgi:hypothetical protein